MTTETNARYLCKTCGAETPTGIGYATTAPGTLPAPDPECRGMHLAGEVAGKQLIQCTQRGCKHTFFHVAARLFPDLCMDHADQAAADLRPGFRPFRVMA